MKICRVAGIAFACVFAAACTKPASEVGGAAAPVVEPAASEVASAAAPTFVYNAYVAKAISSDGTAEEPGTTFLSSEKVYVGVVLRGQAEAADVKVVWSDAGEQATGSEQVIIPVTGASVATLDITSSAMLPPGAYNAIVSLDGKPSWELVFEVTQ